MQRIINFLNDINISKGIYLLEIFAGNDFEISAVKFKGFKFKKGIYYYSGSAQKNFSHRIKRHLEKEKTIHWHIDHLTTNVNSRIENIFYWKNSGKDFECELVKILISKFNLSDEIIGFGNGDCKICRTHFLFSQNKIDQSLFISLYQPQVLRIPSSIEISCL